MLKQFDIFGQPVVLLVTSDMTAGGFSIGQQTCAPGTGVPPHVHVNEDEAFSAISGRFEIFSDEVWTEIPTGGVVFAPRGKVHCFRNSGETDGTIQFICSGDRFDKFLEGLRVYSMPEDMQAMVDYSAEFGITYPTLPPPTVRGKRP